MGFGPCVVDLDGDGNRDLVSGSWPGAIYLFRGLGEGKYGEGEILVDKLARTDEYKKYNYSLLQAAAVTAADWDADGDVDLVVGEIKGKIYVLPNEGDAKNPAFGEARMLFNGQAGEVRFAKSGPCAHDWDGDGDLDLVVGNESVGLFLFENTGTKEKGELGAPRELLINGRSFKEKGYRPKPCITDWNGDGVPDLLVGICERTTKPDGSRGPTGGPVWLCLGKKEPK